MPPNADLGGAGAQGVAGLSEVKKDLKTLAETEVAIDGIVYTLENFSHPGGDAIRLFGGNDVSVLYRMIHPFHAPGALRSMTSVGITSTQTDYKFGSEFEKDLKTAVGKIVKPNERFATPGFWFRCIMYIGIYFGLLFSYIYFGSSWKLCVALGIAQAWIGQRWLSCFSDRLQADLGFPASRTRPQCST
jgi:fatty acid desaturase (delta-4 desaturase)